MSAKTRSILGYCRGCGREIRLEDMDDDKTVRALLTLYAGLPAGLGGLLQRYVNLFRASDRRKLALETVLALSQQVLALDMDKDTLREALRVTVDNLYRGERKPLKNHNYLCSVGEGLGRRAVKEKTAPPPKPADAPGYNPRKEFKGTPMPANVRAEMTRVLNQAAGENEAARLARIEAKRREAEGILAQSKKGNT